MPPPCLHLHFQHPSHPPSPPVPHHPPSYLVLSLTKNILKIIEMFGLEPWIRIWKIIIYRRDHACPHHAPHPGVEGLGMRIRVDGEGVTLQVGFCLTETRTLMEKCLLPFRLRFSRIINSECDDASCISKSFSHFFLIPVFLSRVLWRHGDVEREHPDRRKSNCQAALWIRHGELQHVSESNHLEQKTSR